MQQLKILVTGGAGYIGSHMVKALVATGAHVVVIDDLSRGHANAVAGAELVRCSIGDAEAVGETLARHGFDAVMHFAAASLVGESMSDPALYYRNNVAYTQVLLDQMRAHGVRRFVLSSTAALFGEPDRVPIDERSAVRPINPYGQSKAMVEQMLQDYDLAYGLRSVSLRYFNAAGADPDGAIGERHDPETHLIPLVLQAASGRREAIAIYGSDYDTPDGTCVRDFIHVSDLCGAHLLALRRLMGNAPSARYNLGNGQGFSVLQVVQAAMRVTGRQIVVRHHPRRPGDPARLVADSALACRELGWSPRRGNLETIIADAWRWEQKYPWS